MHRAVKTALAPPTGPVFLSLPGDILKNDADIDLLEPTRVAPRVRGDADAIAAAAELLAKAERPVIIAGDAVAQSRAHKELVALAEADRRAGLCRVHSEHRLVSGVASALSRHDDPLAGRRARRARQARSGVFGRRRSVHLVAAVATIDPWPPGLPLIHLDTDPWQIGKNYPAQVAILGDPKATLPDITAAVGARMTRERQERRGGAAEIAHRDDQEETARRSAPRRARSPARRRCSRWRLLEAIGAMLPKDAVVIEEILSSAPGIRELIDSDDEQSYFGLRGGGIGWGLPAAIGVKLALPERPVVALIGDGSAMYTVQALWTAARYRLPVVWVIFNNTSYRILKQRLVMLRGLAEQADTFVGMELNDPAIDFVGLARSLGIDGARAATVHDATDLIAKALKDNKAMLIDVDMERGYKPM